MRIQSRGSLPLQLSTPGLDETVVVAIPQVRITEFMAINDTTHKDASGDSPDWLELYNPSGVPADLTGWALTDDPLEPLVGSFPITQLLRPILASSFSPLGAKPSRNRNFMQISSLVVQRVAFSH